MSGIAQSASLAKDSIEFNKLHFEQVKQDKLGQKWLVLLWSVDCPPCMKELALVQKLQQKQEDLAVIMINTDTEESSEKERNDIIKHFDLVNLKSFHFTQGQETQQRYQIDPQWFGELPRSYFIDEQGTFHGKSGLIAEELLTQWLLPISTVVELR
tara:strand:- start:330 stop:797 length:468 start_codon:yes stop_codon:yes gene_type:complete